MSHTVTQHALTASVSAAPDHRRGRGAAAQWQRAATTVQDVGTLLTVIFAIPFVILAVGLPIVLAVQLVLWLGRPLFS